ncbi:unnamed protein product [Litomosoides sigmodontis]|uniref:EGF-like domain-containing protein n=1 Tax=Litomosoides sigmodontis TaxID=42156 RepID=A0A3P6SQR1_LITSI|nr:unnamed protein product [Litomosoides sigmodontis]
MYGGNTRWNVCAQQRKAFVNPQSECRVKCLNGGFCAYLVDDPSVHTCLCLLNVYYGDRCQYAVGETTTLATDSTERLLLHHSGGEGFEIEHRRHEPSSPVQAGKLSDGEALKYDEMSQFGYTKIYQVKEPKRIISTEEMKMDENDYTEGWNTATGDDDEYSYDDRADADSLDTAGSDSSIPVWLQEPDDYRTLIEQENPQGIYLNKKKADQIVTRLNKDKRMKNTDGESLVRWTAEGDDNSDSGDLVTEWQSMDDGWMISKRRRVITSGAAVITSNPLQLTSSLIFLVMPLLRWQQFV